MKWMARSLLFVSCLLFFVQTEVAFCQDQITVSLGETISNLQLGLENTGSIGYDAYADPGGGAASWCVPMRVSFGYVWPGEKKWATYKLMVPRDVSLGTYELIWTFYARAFMAGPAGFQEQYLFRSTVEITVVAARDPIRLLPIWAVVCTAAIAPLWYWTRKRTT
jgi:hypothetical protein